MPDPTRDLPPAGHPTADPSANGHTVDLTSGLTNAPGANTPAAPDGPPTVPGYELLEEVGRGGMGVVYRARDLAFGRDVAVKLLQDKYPASGVAARRFADEARITGQLQHPGIPAAYQTGTLPDGRPFLAMKLIKGRTLDDLLKDRAGSPNLVAAFESLCQAVGYAHAHGVVHRDLKPSNVMVGAFGEVQVMDWGLAKVVASGGRPPAELTNEDATAPGTEIESDRDEYDATRAGSVLGTPAYMPPEQAIGAVDEVDARSDVFGLGAVLCAVLTGMPPYTGGSAEANRKLAARAELDDAYARLAGCGAEPGLVALCRQCLSAKRADRPAGAELVAKEVAGLRAAADDRARQADLDRVRAEGDRAAAEAEAREQRKRRRVQLVLGSAVLLTLLVGGGLAGWQWRRAEGALGKVTAEGEAKDDAWRKTLAALRKLTDQLIGDRAERQHDLTDRDRQFFRDVIGLWEEYAQARGDGPEADAIRAEGVFRVGEIRSDLGQLAEAEAAFRAALAIRERPAAGRPTDPGPQAELAEAQVALGRVLNSTGRGGDAELAFRAGLGVYERLAAAHPAVPSYQKGQFGAYLSLGSVLDESGRRAEAEQVYRTALGIAERLATAHPETTNHQTDLALININIGNLLDRAGQSADTERHYRTALGIFERLAAAHPDVAGHQQGMALAYNNLGEVLERAGRLADAERSCRAALGIAERLVTDRPGDLKLRNGLAAAHLNLSDHLARTGRPADAEPEARVGLGIYARLAAAHPSVPGYEYGVAQSHLVLGSSLVRTGGSAEAESSYRTALGIFERLAASHPDETGHQGGLARAHNSLGTLLQAAGRPADAEAAFRAALAIYERLSAATPNNNRPQEERSRTLSNLGIVLSGTGRPADAERAYREAIRLNPQYPKARFNLGAMLYKQGDLAGAVEVYRAAAAAFPDHADIKHNRRLIERAAALGGRLPAVKSGADKPASPAEAVEMAGLAIRPFLKEHALAVRLYANAFAADPKLAREVNRHRYYAARAAVLTAAGDDPSAAVGWDEWGVLQDRAFAWLMADLAALREQAGSDLPAIRDKAADTLAHWQKDDDLGSVRDPARRAWMPAPDRARWEKFWAEVEALQVSALPPVAPPPREAKR